MRRKLTLRSVGSSVALLSFAGLTVFLFQNATNSAVSLTPSILNASSELPDPVPNLCLPMRTVAQPDLLRPVLATRNTACVMCHAQIKGDVVTDFGYGDPFFMGLDNVQYHPLQTSYYGPFASKHFIWESNTWSASAIMGNVYVPDAELTDSRLLTAYTSGGNTISGPLKLVDFLNARFLDPTFSPPTVTTLIPHTSSTDINVPGLRGNIISRKSIWIDAPAFDEIQGLTNLPGAVPVFAGLGLVIMKSQESDVLVGLSSHESQNTHKLFAMNDGLVTCRGDVVIDGTVFLNNLQLATDNAGCRLYVTGTVFIQGPVNYVNGANSNLQITSSRAIIIGMRSLIPRLTQKMTTPTVAGIRSGWTDDDELAFNTSIVSDRDSIDGLTDDAGPYQTMADASGKIVAYQSDFDNNVWLPAPGVTGPINPSTCSTCTVTWAGAYMRKTVTYTHMILNAPKVYGRYYGVFTGSIIAEDVMFAINAFSFQSDPVLSTVKLLPLVGDRIFSMSSD